MLVAQSSGNLFCTAMNASDSLQIKQQSAASQQRVRAWAWHDGALLILFSASLLLFIIIFLSIGGQIYIQQYTPTAQHMTTTDARVHLGYYLLASVLAY